MNQNFKGFWGFWRGVFSEADGTPSSSRIFTALLVAFSLGWVTHLVWHDNALPDFAGLALFVGTLYGTNKVAGALSGKNIPPSQ